MKSSSIKHMVGVALSFCVAVPAFAQMAMPGRFSVSPSGAATYTIPIQVPPGISGVEPAVFLNYNSQAGNGLLGVGWSLSAGSAITRCPKNKAQDGTIEGVGFNTNDRFCLDGQRLVLENGTYGAVGSEYRTEIDGFSKIIVKDAYYFFGMNVGPRSFIVKNKSGLIMEYGGSDNSRKLNSLNVATWALSRTFDRFGNDINYVYKKEIDSYGNGNDLDQYLDNISYGGNADKNLAAVNTVSFVYDDLRKDVRSGYFRGNRVVLKKRLRNIFISSGGSNVLTYGIQYTTSLGTLRSVITGVTQCDANNNCLPATSSLVPSGSAVAPITPNHKFTVTSSLDRVRALAFSATTGEYSYYFESEPVISKKSSALQDSCLINCGKWYSLDVDGDGRVDLVHMTTNPFDARVWRSNADGTFAVAQVPQNTVDRDLQNGSWQVMDVNGDGLYDLVHITTNPGNVILWISNGDGSFAMKSITVAGDTNLSNGSWQVMDVDGDGLADLIHITSNPGDIRVWKSTGAGGFVVSSHPIITTDTALTAGSWYAMDVDGDGLTDLVHINNTNTTSYVWRSNGDGTFRVTNFVINLVAADPSAGLFGSDPFQLMDVNGDGLLDLVQMTMTGGVLHVFLSKGNGEFDYSTFTTTVDKATQSGFWRSVDFNGDGLVDLIHVADDSGAYYLWLSIGNGSFAITSLSGSPDSCLLKCGSILAGDFRGDGFVDLVHLSSDSGDYVSWQMPRMFKDVPTSITNNVNASVSWETAPLPAILNKGDGTAAATYQMDPRSARPSLTTTMITPVRVVTNSSAEDGIGGRREVIYSYGSARNDASRGYLGFGWTQQVDKSTGLVRRTKFLQNFPYVASIDTVGTGTSVANWSNLTLQKYSYGCFLTTDKSLCTSANIIPGQRYFPYVSQIDSQAWDLDGTALPWVRIANKDPDLYGNFWKITNETLDAAGNKTDFSKTIVNKYAAPDTSRWIVDRLLTRTVTTSGPTVPMPVVPGTGALASAPAPVLPTSVLIPIISYLLDDN